ncbi:hypothetical protein [Solemya velum gill symbiont]|uniref:hypothetical protein n=1 Tax=Solemya velum gill symbiont TaxID=2340 RepID=UPI0009987E71|nr:hypothetical protein [Solemya velum gill symbiont]OOY67272.1 hypothetical protein BOW06_07205 [Solemya velum gill symbiont]OOY94012.1 hypothetical protein BOW18_12100 [Solemya velum gill symbiont]
MLNSDLEIAENVTALAEARIQERNKIGRFRRKPHTFAVIPMGILQDLVPLGRKKYRSIVVAVWISSLWDGWTGRNDRKSRHIPRQDVLMTKRWMHQEFGYSESTIYDALIDLLGTNQLEVTSKGHYSKNGAQGTKYRPNWMPAKGRKIFVYWGLLTSDAFLNLSITEQAVLILLHVHHHRKINRLTLSGGALVEFGIHRNRLPEYIDKFRHTGLLDHVEGHIYAFSWFDEKGSPIFDHLNKNTDAPNSYSTCTQHIPKKISVAG